MIIQIRKASLGDAEFLLQLRNQPANRLASFNSEIIKFDQHVGWLKSVLDNPEECLYIAIYNAIPVGQFRINKDRKVSVSLDQSVQGKGFGAQLIRQASLDYLKVKCGEIFAEIKPENTASIAAFKKAGYTDFKSDTEKIVLRFNE